MSKAKKEGKKLEGKDAAPLKDVASAIDSHYPNQWKNKMMMDAFGSGRYYCFDPVENEKVFKDNQETPEFPQVVHLKFEPGFITSLAAETIASMFDKYGDFYLFKDSHNSAFLEFFFVDPKAVPEKTLEKFIEAVKSDEMLHVIDGCLH